MNEKNDLTILMPIYNHARYVTEAVESILKQTQLPKRLLIIDDASTDNSAQLSSAYAEQYDFIEFVQNPSRVGPNRIFNSQLIRVTTEYIFFIAADDAIHPQLCEIALNLLNEYPRAGVFSALSSVMDGESRYVRRYYSPIVSRRPIYFSPQDCKKLYHSDGNWILGCTRFFRTTALKEVGDFPEALHSFSDTYVAMAVTSKWGACFSPHYLSKFRITQGNYSVGVMSNSVLLKAIMQQTVREFTVNNYLTAQEASLWKKRFMLSAVLAVFKSNKQFNLAMLKELVPDEFVVAKRLVTFCYPLLALRIHVVNGVLLYALVRPTDLWQRMYRYLFYTLPCRIKNRKDDYVRELVPGRIE